MSETSGIAMFEKRWGIQYRAVNIQTENEYTQLDTDNIQHNYQQTQTIYNTITSRHRQYTTQLLVDTDNIQHNYQ